MKRTLPATLTILLGVVLCVSNQANSKSEPATFQEYLEIANKNIKINRLLEGAEALKKATELSGSKHPLLHRRLATLYYGMGLIPEAIHEGETAVELEPSSPWYKYDLAKFYYVDKQYAKAEQQFTALLQLKPGFTLAYYYLGEIFYHERHYRLAWQALRRAQLLGYRGNSLQEKLLTRSEKHLDSPISDETAPSLFRFIKANSTEQAQALLTEIREGKLFEYLELKAEKEDHTLECGIMLLDELKDSIADHLREKSPYSPPEIVQTGDTYLIMQRILPFNKRLWEQPQTSGHEGISKPPSEIHPTPPPLEPPATAVKSRHLAEETPEEPMLFSSKIASLYAIENWKEAWVNQNVADYLKSYSHKFTPPTDLSLKEWQEKRREALTRPGFIKITIADQVIETLSATQLLATFKQTYRSDTYYDEVVKTLTMEKEDSGWKIVDERVVRIIKK